jgi:hypothetical protein
MLFHTRLFPLLAALEVQVDTLLPRGEPPARGRSRARAGELTVAWTEAVEYYSGARGTPVVERAVGKRKCRSAGLNPSGVRNHGNLQESSLAIVMVVKQIF